MTRRRAWAWAGVNLACLLIFAVLLLDAVVRGRPGWFVWLFALLVWNGWRLGQNVADAVGER